MPVAPDLDGGLLPLDELRPPTGAWGVFPCCADPGPVLAEPEVGLLGPLGPVRGDGVEGAIAPAHVFCGARAESVNVPGYPGPASSNSGLRRCGRSSKRGLSYPAGLAEMEGGNRDRERRRIKGRREEMGDMVSGNFYC